MEKKNNSTLAAVKAAFPYTIPVLTGYLCIGIAFGIMISEKGYNFLWAALMSLTIYGGSAQYIAVNFFVPGMSLVSIVVMEFMLNVRHIFYGLSMLEKFEKMGKARGYMIFSLTDETYSLICGTKIPEGVDEKKFLLAIAMMDQSYWIIGSAIGAIAGKLIPFSMEGVDFAMTALFVVIFTDQWLSTKNHIPALIGLGCTFVALKLFGTQNFILISMVAILVLLIGGRKFIEPKSKESEDGKAQESKVEGETE